jgi:hypothetical protein
MKTEQQMKTEWGDGYERTFYIYGIISSRSASFSAMFTSTILEASPLALEAYMRGLTDQNPA